MRDLPSGTSLVSTMTRLDAVRLAVPASIRLVGSGESACLYWSIDDGWKQGEPVTDCLSAFMRLARSDDPREFLRFAERFGVLGIRADGRPGHPTQSPNLPPTVVEDSVTRHVEPIAAWTIYARHAICLMVLAEALRRQITALGPINANKVLADAGKDLYDANGPRDVPLNQVPNEMFGIVTSYSVSSLVHNLDRLSEHGLATQQLWLANALTWSWLEPSSLTPRVRWEGPEPVLDLDVTSFMGQSDEAGPWSSFALFSVLAGQLAAAFTNAGRYSQCSVCGELFMQRRRRARMDRSRFCSPPCEREGELRRKRKSAAKRRARERSAA